MNGSRFCSLVSTEDQLLPPGECKDKGNDEALVIKIRYLVMHPVHLYAS